MQFVVTISHVNPHTLWTMSNIRWCFFQSVDYKYVENWNLTNNHFEMESDKHYELDQFIKFISNIYLNN
jgi:hypothetical protein